MATITELSMERLEKNKDKKLVRDLGGKEHTLAGVNWDEKKVVILKGMKGDTAYFEAKKFRGHLFFCQICERWRGMTSLCPNNYPNIVVCEDCIDYITHEEMIREQEEEEKRLVDGFRKFKSQNNNYDR